MSTQTLQPPSSNITSLLPRGGITWFELPITIVERALRFYEAVLAEHLIDASANEEPMFLFPRHGGEVSGALTRREHLVPGACGALVYLRVEGTLQDARARCDAAGGTLLTPPMVIPGVPGTFCVVRDTEGNHVGLHAQR